MNPDSILHYKIEKKLGEGGMGEVFLATDTKLDRKVALKFLPPHFTKDSEFKPRAPTPSPRHEMPGGSL